MDPLDSYVYAIDSSLNFINISDCSVTGANGALDDVNEQERYDILDYFVEDDLDFIDEVDWDRLIDDDLFSFFFRGTP